MIKPDKGCAVIEIEWIQSRILAIHSKQAFNEFVELNKLHDTADSNGKLFKEEWNIVNGCVWTLRDAGTPFHVMVLKKRALRTLVHECCHGAQMLLNAKGIEDDTGETMAYMTDYLFSEIRKAIKIK